VLLHLCRDLDDSASLDDISFEQSALQRGSTNSVNLSVATTDSSSSSSGFSLNIAKVRFILMRCVSDFGQTFIVIGAMQRFCLLLLILSQFCNDTNINNEETSRLCKCSTLLSNVFHVLLSFVR
jgi:hypothetical protein